VQKRLVVWLSVFYSRGPSSRALVRKRGRTLREKRCCSLRPSGGEEILKALPESAYPCQGRIQSFRPLGEVANMRERGKKLRRKKKCPRRTTTGQRVLAAGKKGIPRLNDHSLIKEKFGTSAFPAAACGPRKNSRFGFPKHTFTGGVLPYNTKDPR